MTTATALDFDACYRAVVSRDARFDGRFFTGVRSTGVYCRPICPARTPLARNVEFFPHAAAAEAAGYRSCRRCRPESSPGSRNWDFHGDLVGRALRLIDAGAVDESGVGGLAGRLAVSERHLTRLFTARLGVGPLAVARTRRAQLALQLLDQTSLPVTDIAYASGFASLRQFNATMQQLYARTPSELRGGRRRARAELELRLTARQPYDGAGVLDYLALRAIPGVEEVTPTAYRRSIATPSGAAVLELEPRGDHVVLRLAGGSTRHLTSVVGRARRLLDLDADPTAVGAVLSADPLLAPLVAKRPGLRVPGAYDGFELAVRALLGQQVTVAAASTITGRLARLAGTALDAPDGGVTHVFPTAAAVADADLTTLGIPGKRADALRALATAVALGGIDLDGGDPEDTQAALVALPGIGPWTASYIAMRALRDPDAFPASDLGLRKASAARGGPSTASALDAHSELWRPWRAYAAAHLWASLSEEYA